MLGEGEQMNDLRRVRSTDQSLLMVQSPERTFLMVQEEQESKDTADDNLDNTGRWRSENQEDETDLRGGIKALPGLLIAHKRIIIRDNAVNAVCYGANVFVAGIMRYEIGIDIDHEIVIITKKGEAVALAVALMSTSTISSSCDHGLVAKLKRVIMKRDTYPRKWRLGRIAVYKKQLIAEGKLDKFGKPIKTTNSDWLISYLENLNERNENGDANSDGATKATASTANADDPNNSVKGDLEKEEKTDSEVPEALAGDGSGIGTMEGKPTRDAHTSLLKENKKDTEAPEAVAVDGSGNGTMEAKTTIDADTLLLKKKTSDTEAPEAIAEDGSGIGNMEGKTTTDAHTSLLKENKRDTEAPEAVAVDDKTTTTDAETLLLKEKKNQG